MAPPDGRRLVQACAAAGEEARLLPQVPMKLKLADRTAALLALTPVGTAAALVVRAPVVTAGLREELEMLWGNAAPIDPERAAAAVPRLPSGQAAVLALV